MKKRDRHQFSITVIPSQDGTSLDELVHKMSHLILDLLAQAENAHRSPSQTENSTDGHTSHPEDQGGD
ncbi:hypothetical protein [Alicyclobacillus dauci]|uniref:Uncharacterized protein n=1 Tax=Alicyclobacillus dauci TaxID=1475485 RepID=A0ABY6YY13_9BACL|nr:hypothetical protein [Alicyclobacillus dauci]WAH35317.1 hypothetical protein NZD86_13475 [Alicyclobacillus dauci]